MDGPSKRIAARGLGRRAIVARPQPTFSSGTRRTGSRWLAAAAAALCALAPAAAARSHDVRSRDVRFVLDDFESPAWPDPAVWTLPADASTWRPSGCQAAGGQRALRAFAAHGATADAPCDAVVPAGASSTAFLTLDLRAAGAANRLELGFDVWFRLSAADDAGLVVWLLAPRPGGTVDRVPVFGATGDGGAWAVPQRYLDLRNLSDVRNPASVFDLRGARWTLEWTATAPAGAPAGGGVFVDNVALTWEPDLSYPTPTHPPTLPPTATRPPPTPVRTRTPTDEPTPTDLPPVTPTPSPARAFLPLLRNDPPPTPTPTPSATDTETAPPTATAWPNDTPSPGETATTGPTAEASATAAKGSP